jgi:hypothetical protein
LFRLSALPLPDVASWRPAQVRLGGEYGVDARREGVGVGEVVLGERQVVGIEQTAIGPHEFGM